MLLLSTTNKLPLLVTSWSEQMVLATEFTVPFNQIEQGLHSCSTSCQGHITTPA